MSARRVKFVAVADGRHINSRPINGRAERVSYVVSSLGSILLILYEAEGLASC